MVDKLYKSIIFMYTQSIASIKSNTDHTDLSREVFSTSAGLCKHLKLGHVRCTGFLREVTQKERGLHGYAWKINH
jgi:hypothetical protein